MHQGPRTKVWRPPMPPPMLLGRSLLLGEARPIDEGNHRERASLPFCLISNRPESGPLLTPCMIGPHRDAGLSRPQPCPVPPACLCRLLNLPYSGWTPSPLSQTPSTYRSVRLPWTRPRSVGILGHLVPKTDLVGKGRALPRSLGYPSPGSRLLTEARSSRNVSLQQSEWETPSEPCIRTLLQRFLSESEGEGAILVWPSSRSTTAWDNSSMH